MLPILTIRSSRMRHCFTTLLVAFATTGFAQQAVFTWGDNYIGLLGDGLFDFNNPSSWYTAPQPMTCHDDWKAITAGDIIFQGIRQNGTLWTWGFNTGLGVVPETSLGGIYSQPLAVQIGTDSDWKFSSTNGGHSLALKTDGSLWAWGENSSGSIGDGTYTNVEFPKRIGADANWATVHASSASFGIKKDGTLWAWGNNVRGALGTGSTAPYIPTPRLVNTDADWDKLSTGPGGSTIAVIKTDGSLWTWGNNGAGTLGLGLPVFDFTTNLPVFVTTPTQVGTGNNWKMVSANWSTMAAVKTDGTLWTWGSNLNGLLGDGGSDRNSPQQIGTDQDWASVFLSTNLAVATKTDGSLWIWGDRAEFNSGGVPVRIGTDTGWNSAVAGNNFFAVLKDIPFDPVPVPLELGQNIHSCQSTVTLQSSITDAALYKWTTPTGTFKGQATLDVTTNGTYKLSIIKSGCRSTDEVTVNVNASSLGSFSVAGTPIAGCTDVYDVTKPLRLVNETELTGAISWSWGNGETSSATDPQYTYQQPGHYTITLQGECGFSANKEIDVLPILSLGEDRTVCQSTLLLSGNLSTANRYTWLLPDGTNVSQQAYNATQSGTYTLTAEQSGCAQTDNIAILFESDEPGSFTATSAGIVLEDNATILAGMPITFHNTNPAGSNYTWDLGNGEISGELRMEYTYPEPGEYRVTLTGKSTAGCPRFAEKTIRVEHIIITDAISPNGDGKNDKLHISPLIYEAELIVTDQNGRTVFKAAPYQDDFTGNNLETGVYYYHVKLKGTETSYKGFIHIIR